MSFTKIQLAIGAIIFVGLIILVAVLINKSQPNGPSSSDQSSVTNTTTDQVQSSNNYYQNVAAWQNASVTQAGFSLSYPIDFDTQQNPAAPVTTDWRLNADNTPGTKVFTLTIPRAFEPQTNFDDATLNVGLSSDSAALASCLQASNGETQMSGQTIDGQNFSVFTFNGAGAGNRYDTTSFRINHGGKCYAIEYTIHSSELGNYPPSLGLKEFDKAKVQDVINRIVNTFKFR